MKYNLDYLTIKYALIKSFLIKANVNLLDISYSVDSRIIAIQVVALGDSITSDLLKDDVKRFLTGFEIEVVVLSLSKEKFNESSGQWMPKYYQWKEEVLFSKAEAL